jgi:galactose-1-phosphate uridylyltransferase
MKNRQPIKFESVVEESDILISSNGFKTDTHKIEHRRDPLTGHRSFIGLRLTEKYKTLVGDTDHDLISKLAASSAEKCFFCPEKAMSATPRFPDSVLRGGRIVVGESILFPNLFPLSLYHAIVVPSKKHFLRPEEFSPELVANAFRAAQIFIKGVPNPRMLYGSLDCNYMPPAGASAIHPHFQVIVSSIPSNYTETISNALESYRKRNRSIYWDDLVEIEKQMGDRYIGSTGPVEWLTTYSPRGLNEVLGICPRGSFSRLADSVIEALAQGVSHILAFYGKQDYSSFNMSMEMGRLESDEPWNRVTVRLVTRQNYSAGYRAAEHFFQHMLETEVIAVPPELLASQVRKHLSGE